jgi:hypothetical protein
MTEPLQLRVLVTSMQGQINGYHSSGAVIKLNDVKADYLILQI